MKKGSQVVRVFNEVNRLRRAEGLESISMLRLAHEISRFHEDRNPRVAQAMSNLGIPEPRRQLK